MAIFDQWGQPRQWRLLTWPERLGLCAFWAVGWGVVFPALLIGALFIMGAMIEGIGQQNAEHDRCLKHATNGYEIRACR